MKISIPNASQPSLYYIGIVLPEPLQSEITEIKEQLKHKYNWKAALKSPAHITLIPPFSFLESDESKLTGFCLNFQSGLNPFKITLNGFGHFDRHTLFISVASNLLLMELYRAINSAFKDFIKDYLQKRKQDVKVFHPHITIGNRDMKPFEFNEAWQYYCQQPFEADFSANSIQLLKHNGQSWDVVYTFNFN